jgi:glutamate-1-semialdehyde 2,1-aminomutase
MAIGAADAQLRARAARVVPGGMHGHKAVWRLPTGYPQFFSGGEDAYVVDADGRRLVDLMCSWGPVVLGHGRAEVERAVAAQLAAGDCLDGPAPVMVELAELLVDTVAHADWMIVAKNGSDVMTLGVQVARAATGRRVVIAAEGSYHGNGAWCSGVGTPGVLPEERAHVVRIAYNDVASLEAAVSTYADDLAAVVLTPFRHDVRRDLEPVDPAFARRARALCDERGAVLVLDEVRTGLRADPRGSWEVLGVRPDLSGWSKAIANGHPIATLLGTDALAGAASAVHATGSFWLSAAPMTAAVATIGIARLPEVRAGTDAAGAALQSGLRSQAEHHGLAVVVSGPPAMPFLTFEGDADFEAARLWAAACLQRGVYLHPTHNWFLGSAHTTEVVEVALSATDDAFAAVRRALESGEVVLGR